MNKKKLLIGLAIVVVAMFALWPVKVACGKKGYTCLSGPRPDGKACGFYTVTPRFAAELGISLNYSRVSTCY